MAVAEQTTYKLLKLLGEPRLRSISAFYDDNREFGEGERFREIDRAEAYYQGVQHGRKTTSWDGRTYLSPDQREAFYAADYAENPKDPAPPWILRRPFIQRKITARVVDRFSGLLFGESRTPNIETTGGEDWMAAFLKSTNFWNRARKIRTVGGAAGTVVPLFSVRNAKPVIDVFSGKYCYPRWKDDDSANGALESLEILVKRPFGRYEMVQKPGEREATLQWITGWEWYRRIVDKYADIALTTDISKKLDGYDQRVPLIWQVRSEIQHGLGEVPAVWITNTDTDFGVDGAPDMDGMWDNLDAIDALWSDAFQATHYNAEPTPIISDAQGAPSKIGMGSGKAIWLSEQGKAMLLELQGTGGEAAAKRALELEDKTLEDVRCVLDVDRSADPKTATAIKARMDAMYGRADELREQYGDPLEKLLEIAIRTCRKVETDLKISVVNGASQMPGDDVTLGWAPLRTSTPEEKKIQVDTYSVAKEAGLMSRETAVEKTAPILGIEDAKEELKRIEADEKGRQDKMIEGIGRGLGQTPAKEPEKEPEPKPKEE